MTFAKKIILICIVLIEIALGALFLIKYYQKQLTTEKLLDANNVALINKENTIPFQDEDLKYYWEFLPNQIQEDHPDWLPYKVTYNINKDKLNDRFDYQTQKQEKTYRIITLGDSFTYGHYVNTQENWTEQLEDLLNNSSSTCEYNHFEVINLGMPGYDVQYIVKRYQEIGAKYNPDLILWFESNSGFSRFNELMDPLVESCREDKSNTNLAKQKESIHYCWEQAEKKVQKENSPEYLDEILNKSFESFFNMVDQNKIIFFYYDNMWPKKRKIIEKLKMQYENATFITSIPETPPQERLIDEHPNAKGHKAISRSIFEYLIENNLNCFN